jgi:hypothetical protein
MAEDAVMGKLFAALRTGENKGNVYDAEASWEPSSRENVDFGVLLQLGNSFSACRQNRV